MTAGTTSPVAPSRLERGIDVVRLGALRLAGLVVVEFVASVLILVWGSGLLWWFLRAEGSAAPIGEILGVFAPLAFGDILIYEVAMDTVRYGVESVWVALLIGAVVASYLMALLAVVSAERRIAARWSP